MSYGVDIDKLLKTYLVQTEGDARCSVTLAIWDLLDASPFELEELKEKVGNIKPSLDNFFDPDGVQFPSKKNLVKIIGGLELEREDKARLLCASVGVSYCGLDKDVFEVVDELSVVSKNNRTAVTDALLHQYAISDLMEVDVARAAGAEVETVQYILRPPKRAMSRKSIKIMGKGLGFGRKTEKLIQIAERRSPAKRKSKSDSKVRPLLDSLDLLVGTFGNGRRAVRLFLAKQYSSSSFGSEIDLAHAAGVKEVDVRGAMYVKSDHMPKRESLEKIADALKLEKVVVGGVLAVGYYEPFARHVGEEEVRAKLDRLTSRVGFSISDSVIKLVWGLYQKSGLRPVQMAKAGKFNRSSVNAFFDPKRTGCYTRGSLLKILEALNIAEGGRDYVLCVANGVPFIDRRVDGAVRSYLDDRVAGGSDKEFAVKELLTAAYAVSDFSRKEDIVAMIGTSRKRLNFLVDIDVPLPNRDVVTGLCSVLEIVGEDQKCVLSFAFDTDEEYKQSDLSTSDPQDRRPSADVGCEKHTLEENEATGEKRLGRFATLAEILAQSAFGELELTGVSREFVDCATFSISVESSDSVCALLSRAMGDWEQYLPANADRKFLLNLHDELSSSAGSWGKHKVRSDTLDVIIYMEAQVEQRREAGNDQYLLDGEYVTSKDLEERLSDVLACSGIDVKTRSFLGSISKQARAKRTLSVRQVLAVGSILREISKSKEDGDLRKEVEKLFKESREYFGPHNKRRLQEGCEGRHLCSEREVSWYKKRVKEFKASSIPPVYRPDFEVMYGKSRKIAYPVVDFVVLLGSGAWERAMAVHSSVKRMHGGKSTYFSPIPAASAENFVDYAMGAHDAGEINTHFLCDLNWRLGELKGLDGTGKALCARRTEQVVVYLHKQLEGSIPDKTEYPKVFVGDEDFRFLYSRKVWCLDYSPEDRVRIAEAFLDGVRGPDRKKFRREQRTIDRMAMLFPELDWSTDSITELDVVGPRLNEPKSDDPVQALVEMLGHYYSGSRDGFAREILKNKAQMSKTLGIPNNILHLPRVKEYINKGRLIALQGLTDAQFLERFPSHHSAVNFAVNNLPTDNDLTSAKAVNQYVRERYKSLRS